MYLEYLHFQSDLHEIETSNSGDGDAVNNRSLYEQGEARRVKVSLSLLSQLTKWMLP